ncbi:MAG TPA: hypothetical protein VGK28_11635 [Candidatus Dormibacteraeota bacterium]
MRRTALLAIGATVYALAAWTVAPGFYDGFGPPQPYNWTCPPPQAGANESPSSGHLTIKVIGGVSDANSAFTDDGQLVIGFLPGAFVVEGKTSINVDIKPLQSCPQPAGLHFVTNVYLVSASATLDPQKSANLVLRYSNLEPDPSTIYTATDPNGQWTAMPRSQQAQPFTIQTRTTTFGYFAAGYPSSSPPPGAVTIGGGQVLPIVVAVLIVVVVLAGLPLAILRRRSR